MTPTKQTGKSCCCAKKDGQDGQEEVDEIDDCGSQFCLVEGTQADHDQIAMNRELSNKIWMCSRPPRGYSKTSPAVTARRVQVTQDLLQGELDSGPKAPLPIPTSFEGSSVSQTLIRAGLVPTKRMNVTSAGGPRY